jgi:hypothetical protein
MATDPSSAWKLEERHISAWLPIPYKLNKKKDETSMRV